MIPHSRYRKRFVSLRHPAGVQIPRGFPLLAKLVIWWQTGFPFSLGIAPTGSLGEIDGIGDIDGAFITNTIWINEAVFEIERSLGVANWIITHEILHAKIAILRMKQGTWIGQYRFNLLHRAADEALELTFHNPALADLREVLNRYEAYGLDAGEEGLVRIVQMLLEGQDLPQSDALSRAVKLLARPWGRNPLAFLRITLSLPICIWTKRAPDSRWPRRGR